MELQQQLIDTETRLAKSTNLNKNLQDKLEFDQARKQYGFLNIQPSPARRVKTPVKVMQDVAEDINSRRTPLTAPPETVSPQQKMQNKRASLVRFAKKSKISDNDRMNMINAQILQK